MQKIEQEECVKEPSTAQQPLVGTGAQQTSNAKEESGAEILIDVRIDKAVTTACLDVNTQPVSKAQEESGEQQPVNACQGAQHTPNTSPSAVLLESDAEIPIDVEVDTIATERSSNYSRG